MFHPEKLISLCKVVFPFLTCFGIIVWWIFSNSCVYAYVCVCACVHTRIYIYTMHAHKYNFVCICIYGVYIYFCAWICYTHIYKHMYLFSHFIFYRFWLRFGFEFENSSKASHETNPVLLTWSHYRNARNWINLTEM
jgi:hypothetical protein